MLLMLLWYERHLLRRLIHFIDDIVCHIVWWHRILLLLLLMMVMRLRHHVVLRMLLRRIDRYGLIVSIVVAIRGYVLWMCNELMVLMERGEFHGRTARLHGASERRRVR